MVEEAERAEPVVERDRDDPPPRDEPGRVIDRAGAVCEPAAVHEDHHRKPGRRDARRLDIHRQAVLAAGDLWWLAGERWAGRSGPGGVAHAGPGTHRAGRAPAQRADGWSGVRDALIAAMVG
jgi:hypothetical protein